MKAANRHSSSQLPAVNGWNANYLSGQMFGQEWRPMAGVLLRLEDVRPFLRQSSRPARLARAALESEAGLNGQENGEDTGCRAPRESWTPLGFSASSNDWKSRKSSLVFFSPLLPSLFCRTQLRGEHWRSGHIANCIYVGSWGAQKLT